MLFDFFRRKVSAVDYTGSSIFFSTVIRGVGSNEISGYLMQFDPQKKSIVKKTMITTPSTAKMWGERGGNRGGRGVVVHDGLIYVATASSIIVYDLDFREVKTIENPKFCGLHEILVQSDGIWATSTIHDLLVKVDFEGRTLEEIYLTGEKYLQDYFRFAERKLNLDLDFTGAGSFNEGYEEYCKQEVFHINSIVEYRDEIYVLSSKVNSLIRVKPSFKVIFVDPSLRGPHNCVVIDGKIHVNDTAHQKVNVYDLSTGERIKSIPTCIYPAGSLSRQFAVSGWQRGMADVGNDTLLIGTSPVTLFEVNTKSGRIGEIFRLSDDVAHCVHGLFVHKNR